MGGAKRLRWLPAVWFLLWAAAGCQIAGQVQSGRQALLLRDNPEEALAYFQKAAESDPNYTMRSGPFHEGIWTYLGHAQYRAGRLADSRRSLERALSQDPDDLLAKIYLGLTLARSDDRRRGLQEIQAGLKGLYDWLEYLTYNTYFARYWDPSREIRAQVEKDLTMIAGQNLDWQKLIADVEWIAKRTEEEVDRARQDEQLDLRDRFPRSGVFFGFGF